MLFIMHHGTKFFVFRCDVDSKGQMGCVLFAICTAGKQSGQLCGAILVAFINTTKLIRTNGESTQRTSKWFELISMKVSYDNTGV